MLWDKMLRDIKIKYSLLILWLFAFIFLFGIALGADLDIILKIEVIFTVPAFIIVFISILLMPSTVKHEQQQLSEKLTEITTDRERILIILPAILILSLVTFFVRTGAPTYLTIIIFGIGVVYLVFMIFTLYKKTRKLQVHPFILSSNAYYNFVLVISVIVAIAISILLLLFLL
jgi:hypothetical protein